MQRLNLSEIRSLLYIARRTLGLKKDADAIGIRHMLHGTVTSDGRRLDYGVGVTKRSLLPALNSLENKGLIIRRRTSTARGGDGATVYSLHMKGQDTPAGTPDSPADGGTHPEQGILAEANTSSPVLRYLVSRPRSKWSCRATI